MLERLWSPLAVLTASHRGRSSGSIVSTALSASLLPDAPRVSVTLAKASLTAELALASGAFALHLLAAAPLEPSLALFRRLGFHSGRDADKLAGLPLRNGRTGSPLLEDALCYLEARIVATLDGGDATIALADVVAGERLRAGEPLTIELALAALPAEAAAEWSARREEELAEARRSRC
jgi:flavin reductase (DIM6/NTAB) family NADH-FMN oxidoreductase RutF